MANDPKSLTPEREAEIRSLRKGVGNGFTTRFNLESPAIVDELFAEVERVRALANCPRCGGSTRMEDYSRMSVDGCPTAIDCGCGDGSAHGALSQAEREVERLRGLPTVGDPKAFKDLVLKACTDLGAMGLRHDNPDAMAAVAALIANASRLGSLVDNASLRSRIAEMESDAARSSLGGLTDA